VLAGTLAMTLAGCQPKQRWHNVDITGEFPRLDLTMADASGGGLVDGASFHGWVALLYFGYTDCPDVCPLTLGNIAKILDRLGPLASRVRVLFVTVDPNRDSLETLKAYTAQFAPQIVGLRGTPDQLAALARTYRIAYSVTPATAGHPYEVTHSAAVYAFDAAGMPRLLIPSLASTTPDINGTADDLRKLMTDTDQMSWWDRLRELA
jgi:protein SCO1